MSDVRTESDTEPVLPPATLLVPGWHDTEKALEVCRRRLSGWGWPEQRIRSIGFHDRHGSNLDHAKELGDAIEALVAACDVARVAVVAHSMGGLALRHYLTTTRLHRVHTAIFVGTPHRGTWAAYLAWGAGGTEMRPGSAFLTELHRRVLPADVAAYCISTPIDTRVLPGSSARLIGLPEYRVYLPTHPRMLRHERTLRLVRDLLLNRRPQ